MIARVKKIILIFSFLVISIFLFVPGDFPDNSHFQEGLNSGFPDNVIIVFNSGGWGDTPMEEANDFSPIIEGIQKTLNDLGYKSIVVPYKRTKNSFRGRIKGLMEILSSFQYQSARLSQEIEYFVETNPDTKIIMTGLSNGGAFVDRAMERLSEKEVDNIFAIEIGLPFWEEGLKSNNVLLLDNEGQDPLSEKKTMVLLSSLFKASFKWLLAKVSGEDISFSYALRISDHQYSWHSPTTNSQITTFLKSNFVPRKF